MLFLYIYFDNGFLLVKYSVSYLVLKLQGMAVCSCFTSLNIRQKTIRRFFRLFKKFIRILDPEVCKMNKKNQLNSYNNISFRIILI